MILKFPKSTRTENGKLEFDFYDEFDSNEVLRSIRDVDRDSFIPIIRISLKNGTSIDVSMDVITDFKSTGGQIDLDKIKEELAKINGPFDMSGYLKSRDENWQNMIVEEIKKNLKFGIFDEIHHFYGPTGLVGDEGVAVKTRGCSEYFEPDIKEHFLIEDVSRDINEHFETLKDSGKNIFCFYKIEIRKVLTETGPKYGFVIRYATIPEE